MSSQIKIMAKTYINEREYWEELQVKAVYRWKHAEWLKPKLDYLYSINPNYATRIISGVANLPYKWSWEVWYQSELAKEKEREALPKQQEEDSIF